MAKIGIENIREVRLTVVPTERRFDSEGDLAVHPLVAAAYVEKGYNQKPKSAEEARERGEKGFNGLMSSFSRIAVIPEGAGVLVDATIAPTRYLLGQALRDLEKEGKYLPDVVPQMSPDMANVSLVVPVCVDGENFLVAQIKGKVLGSGEIHAGMVAGNVDARYLMESDPLVATLQSECSEEVGMDLSKLDPTSALYLVDERETGQVNIAYLARGADHAAILHAYDMSVKTKLPAGQALEVMGLAQLPVAGLALVPLEGGRNGLKGITCFFPAGDPSLGLVTTVEDRGVRPYTTATLEYLSKPKNVRFLLEKAGF